MYVIEKTLAAGRRVPIVIDIEDTFKVKGVVLEGGQNLIVTKATSSGRNLISSDKKLTTVSGLLNIMCPEVAMGELTFEIYNPMATNQYFKITIR